MCSIHMMIGSVKTKKQEEGEQIHKMKDQSRSREITTLQVQLSLQGGQ